MIGELPHRIQSAPGGLLTVSMIFGGLSLFFEVCTNIPVVFYSENGRAVKFCNIIAVCAACFFLFITVLTTRSTVSAVIYSINIISLGTIKSTRGTVLEIMLWVSFGLLLLAVLVIIWLHKWEIRDRKETHRAAMVE
jgi:uncharacterized BrkB/YihY/UPF0761 family membrane protein